MIAKNHLCQPNKALTYGSSSIRAEGCAASYVARGTNGPPSRPLPHVIDASMATSARSTTTLKPNTRQCLTLTQTE